MLSAVKTGQMSAVETRQTSSAETGQMYSIGTGQRHVATVDICLVSAADTCLVSTADICPVSTANLRRSGPKSTKMVRNGSRMVARPRESTHMNRTAVPEGLGPVLRPKIRQRVHLQRWWAELFGTPSVGRGMGH